MSQSRGILSIRFNQDQGCFACGLESGFRIYNVHPLAEKTRQEFDEVGGVSHVEMLQRSNILAVVGGGHYPKYPDKKLMIWDDTRKKMVYEISFHSPVLSVRIKRDKLFVVLDEEINVFQFPNPIVHESKISTVFNPKGLFEVAYGSKTIMVYPAKQIGKLQLFEFAPTDASNKDKLTIVINAHTRAISCIAVNHDGTKVATASTKGTIIRVHAIGQGGLKGQSLELRRGTDPAVIQCINFSQDSSLLCVSSDKGTVHIFALNNLELNKRSKLAQVGLFGAYGESLWGLAQFTIPNESSCLCAFGPDNKSVVAVCMDGSFYRYLFTTDPGQTNNCIRDSFDIFLDIGNDGI